MSASPRRPAWPRSGGGWCASRSSWPDAPRFWAAAALLGAALVYAGVQWIPARVSPSPVAPEPLHIPAHILPVLFVEAGPLDLNRATAAELEKLPGIGPVLARRIVEWRETHGPFRSVQDLLKVPGIGPKTLEGLLDKVTVGPPP